jgi:hypothetical protein
MNGWKWQSQGFLLKRGTKVVIKETKGLTLFICKVDSRKCIFCGQNRMRKVKKINDEQCHSLCYTLFNTTKYEHFH